MTSEILKLALISNALSLAVECYRLQQFWDAIRNAKNVVAESKMKVPKITNNIEEIVASIAALDNFVAGIKECTMLDYMKFTQKNRKIIAALNNLKTDIGNLKELKVLDV